MTYLSKKWINLILIPTILAGQDLAFPTTFSNDPVKDTELTTAQMSPSQALGELDKWLLPPAPSHIPPSFTLLSGSNAAVERTVIEHIIHAESEVLFSYQAINSRNFTSHLLHNYHKRKILTAGLLEGKPNIRDYKTIELLTKNGLPILIPPMDRIHNENYIIIDRRIVIHGSYYPSQRVENCHVTILEDPGIANEFYRLWYRRSEESKNPYE